MNDQQYDLKSLIVQFADYVLPKLTPYEASTYFYLLVNSYVKQGVRDIRVGKRTIASDFGMGARGVKTSYAHVSETLKKLEEKGCIRAGDITREGTLYVVNLPEQIPFVAEAMKSVALVHDVETDYFNNSEKRAEIFERDKWICQYCGDKVSPQNATLDHFIPQSRDGKNSWDNLKSCCLDCNSVKSGKTYEEAAPLLLRRLQERRARSI